jgi:hypothetical protein
MPCTSVHFRTPNNVPPDWDLKIKLNRIGGAITESDFEVPRQVDDGTWEALFSYHDKSELADHVREGCAVLTRYGYEIVSEMDCTPKDSRSIDGEIEHICKYPDMVTGYDTFDSVMAYLTGLYNGIEWCKVAPEAAQEAATEWWHFCLWLLKVFPHCHAPHAALRADYSEDKAVLNNLAALWSEYRARGQR